MIAKKYNINMNINKLWIINNMLKRVHQSNSTIDKLYQISSIIQVISYICMEIHATFWRALRKDLWVQILISLTLYVHTLHLSSFFRISTFKKLSEIFYWKKSHSMLISAHFLHFISWVGMGGFGLEWCGREPLRSSIWSLSSSLSSLLCVHSLSQAFLGNSSSFSKTFYTFI